MINSHSVILSYDIHYSIVLVVLIWTRTLQRTLFSVKEVLVYF